MCTFTDNSDLTFLWQIGGNFIFCANCVIPDTNESKWQKSCLDIILWKWTSEYYSNVIINWLCISDYHRISIMIFFPIAHHLCMALAFNMCIIDKQCWSLGYVTFLALFMSFQICRVAKVFCDPPTNEHRLRCISF